MYASDPVPPAPEQGSADRLIAAAARAADGARARLSGAINDLFRPIDNRLNDREHALMTRMLPALIGEIEQELRDRIATGDGFEPALEAVLRDPVHPIALPRLARSRILRDADLAGLLLRRCDEHHVACRLQLAYPGTDGALDRLSRHPDASVRQAVAALLVEESCRIDGFGDPQVRLVDTPLELLHRLAWWVATMLRDYLLDHGLAADLVDHLLAQAVTGLIAGCDPRQAIDQRAAELVEVLAREGLLDEALLAGLMHDGQVALWIACLAHRSGVEAMTIWTMLADPDASRLTLLLRAIGLSRTVALGILAALFAVRAGARAENDMRLTEAAAAFDGLARASAVAALRPYLHDPLAGGAV